MALKNSLRMAMRRQAVGIDLSAQAVGLVVLSCGTRKMGQLRIECVASAPLAAGAMAGITLTTVDVEPHAALRALRHAATFELELHESYAAAWIGSDGVYGWRVEGESLAQEIRYPSPEYSCVANALRDLAHDSSALVGGEIDLLEGVCFSLADIGDVLGCTVLPFDCSALSDGEVIPYSELPHEPGFAVAFGLALRGVAQ